jgi:hypothetical protein
MCMGYAYEIIINFLFLKKKRIYNILPLWKRKFTNESTFRKKMYYDLGKRSCIHFNTYLDTIKYAKYWVKGLASEMYKFQQVIKLLCLNKHY